MGHIGLLLLHLLLLVPMDSPPQESSGGPDMEDLHQLLQAGDEGQRPVGQEPTGLPSVDHFLLTHGDIAEVTDLQVRSMLQYSRFKLFLMPSNIFSIKKEYCKIEIENYLP